MKLSKTCGKTRTGIALSLLMSVSGCSGSAVEAIPTVELPSLDPRDEKPCTDPGVVGTFGEALAANRTALVICIERHGNVVRTYNEARATTGPQ